MVYLVYLHCEIHHKSPYVRFGPGKVLEKSLVLIHQNLWKPCRHVQWLYVPSRSQLNSLPCRLRTEFYRPPLGQEDKDLSWRILPVCGFGYVWHLAVVPIFTPYGRYHSRLVALFYKQWSLSGIWEHFYGYDGVLLWEHRTFQDVIWQLWLV